jgi:hypothetical protein
MKQTQSSLDSEKLKQINKLAKIPNPPNMDGKNEKWKNPITFDQWTAKTQKWLVYQGFDIQHWTALDRASFFLEDSAGIWYDQYCQKTEEEKRNYHEFMLILRKKVVPSILATKL